MAITERIASAAEQRIRAAGDSIQASLRQIHSGFPIRAEPSEDRKLERIALLANVSLETAGRIADNQDPASLGLTGESRSRAEAIQGKTVDYLGVAWLEAGRLASKSVARILFKNGSANGTGFLVSDRLLLTNNHVIGSRNDARSMIVEFQYELALGQKSPAPVRFVLDPDVFFETDSRDDLDYTLVALGSAVAGSATVVDFGKCPLSASGAKHSIGELVNIVQHPDGDFKQIVIRENRIVHRGETVLHYIADTEGGSSGSPVFNDQWQVVALHHWAGPHREVSSGGQPLSRDVNEGIRISAIVGELEQRVAAMNEMQRALLREALNAPPPSDFGVRKVQLASFAGPQSLLSVPPMPLAGEARGGGPANRIDGDYSNRRGYNSRFLPGFPIPMPPLNATQRRDAARVRGMGEMGNPFELQYEHFSVLLNGSRRMPFYSICNIDGSKLIRVNRNTGQATSAPEATEVWAADPRVPEEAQLSDAFYDRMRRDLRTTDFFARGHMTRREDPNWGTAGSAERANDDTYHHTNACPQMQLAFNGAQRVWQGIENFILQSTGDSDLRATVITGPVFGEDDPTYPDEEFGDVRLPRRFWKIVARVENGERKVFAVLADQSLAMDELLSGRGEARGVPFVWLEKLSREFRSTVAEIAELTGLDFGDLVNHDVFADGSESLEERAMSPRTVLFPRRGDGNFGKFESIEDFLESWELTQRSSTMTESDVAGPERRRRAPRPNVPGPLPPLARQRKVVEVNAQVARVFADDLSGAKHQQFTVVLRELLKVDPRATEDVTATLTSTAQVRLAVRFGDSRGLPDRIPGIRFGVELHLKGEWIPASEAFSIGGERTAVLHFTHDPLGFVCTPQKCFS